MGRKQLKDDFAKAEKLFGGATSCIKDLQFDPETIMFMFEAKGHSVSFTLGIDDAYPEGSMLFHPDGEPQIYDVPLARVLEDVAKTYCKKFGIPYEAPAAPATATAPATTSPTVEATTATKVRKLASFVEDDEDEDEDYDDADQNEKSARLEEDLKAVRAHGYTVSFREYQALDMLDVELHINSKFIDHRIGSAWGVASGKPITVRLTVSPSIYDNSHTVPKVEVIQNGVRCGLSTQLQQIIGSFAGEHWKQFGACTNRKVPGAPEAAPAARASSFQAPPSTTTKEKETDKKKKKTALPKGMKEADVSKLVDMGFDRDIAIRALTATNGNMEEASHLLLEDQSGLWETEKNKRVSASQNVDKADFFAQEKSDKELKQYWPDYADGFLLQVCKYVSFRIPMLNKYCVICDGSHLFAGGACLLRPAVCARELCCFAFQSLGVMSDAADGIATQAEVVDLLVCMAMAAANSTRKDAILEPFPAICDKDDRTKMILSANNKDFTLLSSIFNVFPSIEDMMLVQEVTDMKAHLDKAHKYCFPLLQWIINSNRSHIEKIPEARHVKSMGTTYQYVLLSAPPEKEAAFKELKAKHGTVFAFHGSPVENWHCILRTGLRNASGTKLQLNGAAYGNGIYLSPHAATSFGYAMRSAYANNPNAPPKKEAGRFLGSSHFHCVALCEVINTSSIKKHGNIWVCPEENHVVTRFFFVFPPTGNNAYSYNNTALNAVNTESESFLAEVRAALEYM